MPTIPTLSPIQTETQPVSMPRMSGENFGAGAWQNIGKMAESGTKIGETMNLQNFDVARTSAREALNNYRIGLDKDSSDIMSDPSNYKDATAKLQAAQAVRQQQLISTLGKNSMAAQIAAPMIGEHSAPYFKTVDTWQRGITKENENFQIKQSEELTGKDFVNAALQGDEKGMSKHYGELTGLAATKGLSNDIPLGEDGKPREGALSNRQMSANENIKSAADKQLALIAKSGNYQQAIGLIDTLKKKGIYDEASADNMTDSVNQKMLTADGKVATTDAKARVEDMLVKGTENSRVYTRIDDATFHKVIDGAPAEKQIQAIKNRDDARAGVPMGQLEKDAQLWMKKDGGQGGLFYGTNESDRLKPENVKAWDMFAEGLHGLKPQEQNDPKKWKEIMDGVMHPSSFFDGNGINYGHAYQVPNSPSKYATNQEPTKADWKSDFWGSYKRTLLSGVPGVGGGIAEQKDMAPNSSAMTQYAGKSGNFLRTKDGDRYIIRNLDTNEIVGYKAAK